MKHASLIALFLVLAFSFAYGQVDTVGTELALEATPTSGPTLLDKITQLTAGLTPIIATLSSFGILAKYAPFLAKLPNFLIPWINALLAFVLMFGPAPAQAGFFGDLVHGLSFPARAAGSLLISGVARLVYETYLRGIFEKLHIFAAGLTEAQKAAKIKSLNL